MYWMTQVITDHGYFEAYLYEIQESKSPICRHYRAVDNAVHPPSLPFVGETEIGNLFKALNLNLDLDREYNSVIEAIMGSSGVNGSRKLLRDHKK